MLFVLLACFAPQPLDSGAESLPEFPTWSGTQIGEEGDEACALVSEAWADEDAAPPGTDWTPSQLRALGGDYSGTLQSAWQGDESLSAALTLDGAAQALSDTMEQCASALSITGSLVLSSDALLSVELPVTVIARYGSDVTVLGAVADDELLGELSPGLLPDDALALSITVYGAPTGSGWAGELVWELERETGSESSPAGTWAVQ